MRKLKLDVAELRVESFEAHAGGRTLGTVRGNVLTPECSVDETCPGAGTCFEDTCAGCANTSPRPSCADCSGLDDCFTHPSVCD